MLTDLRPAFLAADEADVQLELAGGLLEIEGTAVVRPSASLKIGPPRELIVDRSIRAAFNPDGSVAADTPRYAVTSAGLTLVDEVPAQLPPEPVEEVITDPVVWGGCMTSHYGHFLVESVARLWPLLPGGDLHGLPAVFATPDMPSFAAAWMRGFGAEVVPLPDRPVRFTEMYVPDPCWVTDAYTTPAFLEVHRHARRGMTIPRLGDQGIVWLSRSAIQPPHRRFLDEPVLERVVRGEIRVFHPEKLSLEEQIAVLEASSGVAGVLGSAFHTLLVTEEVPSAIYVCPLRIPSPFVVQDHILGGRGTFVRGLAYEKARAGPDRRTPHRVLIPETLRAIESVLADGLLQQPRLASAAYPERHFAVTAAAQAPAGEGGADLEQRAIAALELDPHGYGPRLMMGEIFEEAGLTDAALEQFRAATQLGEDRWYGRLRVARLLFNLGLHDEAADAARLVLELEPRSVEALQYIAFSEGDAARDDA